MLIISEKAENKNYFSKCNVFPLQKASFQPISERGCYFRTKTESIKAPKKSILFLILILLFSCKRGIMI